MLQGGEAVDGSSSRGLDCFIGLGGYSVITVMVTHSSTSLYHDCEDKEVISLVEQA